MKRQAIQRPRHATRLFSSTLAIPPGCEQAAPLPFTLVLIRLARPDPARQQPEAHPSASTPVPPGPEHLVAVRLVDGEPFRLLLNGELVQEGGGLGEGAPRSVLTIRGHATAEQRAWMRVHRLTTEESICGFLVVAASARHPFGLVLDAGSAAGSSQKGAGAE